jgi:hypothetical protein
LDKKNNNKEGCFWEEGYIGKVALMLGRLALGGDLSVD